MTSAPLCPFVVIDKLYKSYGSDEVIRNLSLSIQKGEIFALLGTNGAGKTTTMRMLMGILAPTSGHARIGGLDCFEDRIEVKRLVGYLPDEPVFYDYLRGSELIDFTGRMHDLSGAEIEARARPLIERLGLAKVLGQFAANYSRGMKKRLAFLCAMLHEPSLLILDEPTSGLDPITTLAVRQVIREKATEGKTILFSTHALDQVEKFGTRIGIMAQGALVACGTFEELRGGDSSCCSLEEIFLSMSGKASVIASS